MKQPAFKQFTQYPLKKGFSQTGILQVMGFRDTLPFKKVGRKKTRAPGLRLARPGADLEAQLTMVFEKETDDPARLLEQVAKGSTAAFEKLYLLEIQKMKHFIFKKGVRSEGLVDDLCQEVFLKVWNKAESFNREKGSAASWLATICQNVIYDHWRKLQRTPFMEELKTYHMEEKASDNKDFEYKELMLLVGRSLAKLKEDEQDLFYRVYQKGQTLKEVALDLDIPLGTIKWKISLIKKVLKEEVLGA